MAVLLKAKIEEHFKDNINIKKIIPGYDVNKSILDDIDFVFTTVPINNIQSDKIIKIHHMLEQDDIDKIEQRVFNKKTALKDDIMSFFQEIIFMLIKILKKKMNAWIFLTNEAIKIFN